MQMNTKHHNPTSLFAVSVSLRLCSSCSALSNAASFSFFMFNIFFLMVSILKVCMQMVQGTKERRMPAEQSQSVRKEDSGSTLSCHPLKLFDCYWLLLHNKYTGTQLPNNYPPIRVNHLKNDDLKLPPFLNRFR